MVFVFSSKSPYVTHLNRESQSYGNQDLLNPSIVTFPQIFSENLTQSIFNNLLGHFNYFNNTLGQINALLPFFGHNWVPLSNDEPQSFVTNSTAYVASNHMEKDNISMYETFIAFNIPNDDVPTVFSQLDNDTYNIKYLP